MKVLEIFGEPIDIGGQESFVFNVLDHMDMTGLSVDVLTPYFWSNQRYRDMLDRLKGKAIVFGLPMEVGKSWRSIYQPLHRFLQEHSYDAVHIHSGSISALAVCALAARRAGVKKIIVHSHCAAEKATLRYRIAKAVMTPVLDFCPTQYCACSRLAGKWKFSRKAVKKLIVLKNGVDLDRFRFSPSGRERVRGLLGIDREAFVIGHVGRFNYQKNQEFLLDVFIRFVKKHPEAVLMLIGEGEFEEKVKEKAKQFGVADKVRFCGNIEDISDYYSAMDVFALPSHFEGLPIVGVEAQANGMPVLVSDRVSEELKLTDCVTYLSLEEQKWLEALEKVMAQERRETREALRANGYDLTTTAARMRKLYLED